MVALLTVAFTVAALLASIFGTRARSARREQFVRTYNYPPGLFDRLAKKRPGLAFKDIALTSRALRHFFLAHLKSRGQFVTMPSQVADDLWHEFILYTKEYEAFCREAFGSFMHHTPAAVLGADRNKNAGLRRTWWWCCREENIDPRRPSRLPLLFALDAKMDIVDGFRYAADCGLPHQLRHDQRAGAAPYCGTSFGDSSVDGSVIGFGDSGGAHGHAAGGVHDSQGGDAGSSQGGNDGGSCGGGSCGGGGD